MKNNRHDSKPQSKKRRSLDSRKSSRKKPIRCSLDVRQLPIERFRLPTDGRKWRQAARSRYSLLGTLAGYANPDGTFENEDRTKNWSPGAKKLLRHYAKNTFYRLSNDLRELGLLSWQREQKHYGRRTYQIHFTALKQVPHSQEQVSDSQTEQVSYSSKKQVPHSQEQVPLRDLITGSMMGPNPSLKTFRLPPTVKSTRAAEGAVRSLSVAAESPPNTQARNATAAAERAFSVFGFERPFGHARFRSSVLSNSVNVKNGNILETMEQVIVDLGGKVPPQWYQTKHSLEEATFKSETTQANIARESSSTNVLFSPQRLRGYCEIVVSRFQKVAMKYPTISREVKRISETYQDLILTACDVPGPQNLEALEYSLRTLDDAIFALLQNKAGPELAGRIRREVQSHLKTYRTTMKPEQLALVENQYFQKGILDAFELPRLSLYYMT
jgi:hypothetical protein